MTAQFVVNAALPTRPLPCSTPNFSCNQYTDLQHSSMERSLESMGYESGLLRYYDPQCMAQREHMVLSRLFRARRFGQGR
jgi:hypothetical protein